MISFYPLRQSLESLESIYPYLSMVHSIKIKKYEHSRISKISEFLIRRQFPEIIKSIFRGSNNDKGVAGCLLPSGGISCHPLQNG